MLVEDTSKTDDESSDLDDDDVMLGSASRNSKSDKAILSLFLLDTEESDFFQFWAKARLIHHQMSKALHFEFSSSSF